MIQFPPMETFDDGELDDSKKLAKKILEETAELIVSSQRDTREHMLDEFADVLQKLANFYKYSGITADEIAKIISSNNAKIIDKIIN